MTDTYFKNFETYREWESRAGVCRDGRVKRKPSLSDYDGDDNPSWDSEMKDF